MIVYVKYVIIVSLEDALRWIKSHIGVAGSELPITTLNWSLFYNIPFSSAIIILLSIL